MKQGSEGPVVDGLDLRDRVEPDPLIGAVQTLVVDTEPGRGRDAEPGEVVTDTGRPPALWSSWMRAVALAIALGVALLPPEWPAMP